MLTLRSGFIEIDRIAGFMPRLIQHLGWNGHCDVPQRARTVFYDGLAGDDFRYLPVETGIKERGASVRYGRGDAAIGFDIGAGIEVVGDLPDIKLETLQGRLVEIGGKRDAGNDQREDEPGGRQTDQAPDQRVAAMGQPGNDPADPLRRCHRLPTSSCSGFRR